MKCALGNTGADVTGPDKRSESREAAQSNKTILVVDDEPELRRLWRFMLQRDGYNVLEAGSAESAKDVWKARSKAIELLLTDYNMPGETGLQLAEALHAENSHLRVLMASGSCAADLAVPSFVSFLSKPFTLQALSEAVSSKMQANR